MMRLEHDPFLVSHGPFAGDEFVNFRGGTRWATSYKLQVGAHNSIKKGEKNPVTDLFWAIYRGYTSNLQGIWTKLLIYKIYKPIYTNDFIAFIMIGLGPKGNMEPENDGSQKNSPGLWNFRGVMYAHIWAMNK